MVKLKIGKAVILFGILGVVFYFLHDIVGAHFYPNYQWTKQAVSDLTASDAPSFTVANGIVSFYKILSCFACLGACILCKEKGKRTLNIGVVLFTVMTFISAIGYAMFPLSSSGYDGTIQSFIHVYVLTICVVVLSIISLIMIIIGAARLGDKWLAFSSIIALMLMFIGAVGSANVPKEYFGIVERFSTYSVVLFTAVLSIYAYKISISTKV